MDSAWDIHKDYVAILTLKDGENVNDKGASDVVEIPATYAEIAQYVSNMPKDTRVLFEAGLAWEFIYDILQMNGIETYVVNPSDVQPPKNQKRKRRNDFEALRRMLRMLHINEFDSITVPPKEDRDRRELTRTRAYLVRQRTQLKNRITSQLAKNGIKPKLSDLFGKAGRKLLEELQVNRCLLIALNTQLAVLDEIDSQITALEGEIAITATEEKRILTMMTIPGCGFRLASVFAFEMGPVSNYPDGRHLASHAGLTTSLTKSGKTEYTGSISKEGNAVMRWALVEMARAHINTKGFDSDLKRFYNRLKPSKGYGKAIVAMARKLAVVIYAMLKNERQYDPLYLNKGELVKDSKSKPDLLAMEETMEKKQYFRTQTMKRCAKRYELGNASQVCTQAVQISVEEN